MNFSKFYNPSEHLAVDKVIVKFKGRVLFKQYSPKKRKRRVISLGAGDWIQGRPSDCHDEGSVRTLKNKFKSTGRSLNDVLKYTVGGSDVLATRVETSVPPSRYNYMTLYMAWKGAV